MLELSEQQYYEEQRLSTGYSIVTVDSSTMGTYYIKDSENVCSRHKVKMKNKWLTFTNLF